MQVKIRTTKVILEVCCEAKISNKMSTSSSFEEESLRLFDETYHIDILAPSALLPPCKDRDEDAVEQHSKVPMSFNEFLRSLQVDTKLKDGAYKFIKFHTGQYVKEWQEYKEDNLANSRIMSWKNFPYPLFNVKDKTEDMNDKITVVFFMPVMPFRTDLCFVQYKAVGVAVGDFVFGGDDTNDMNVMKTYEYVPGMQLDDDMKDRWCHLLDQVVPQLPDRYPLATENDVCILSTIYILCTDLQPKRSFDAAMEDLWTKIA